MPGSERNKVISNLVLGFGALYAAYKVYKNFDAREGAVKALSFITEYDSRKDTGTVEGIAWEIPRRLPFEIRVGFAELIATPDTPWRTIRSSLIHDFDVTRIQEKPCVLEGLTIQLSEELSPNPRRDRDGNLFAETRIRVVGDDLLRVIKNPRIPRYIDDPGVNIIHEMPQIDPKFLDATPRDDSE